MTEVQRLLDQAQSDDAFGVVTAMARLRSRRFGESISPFPGSYGLNGNASRFGEGSDGNEARGWLCAQRFTRLEIIGWTV